MISRRNIKAEWSKHEIMDGQASTSPYPNGFKSAKLKQLKSLFAGLYPVDNA